MSIIFRELSNHKYIYDMKELIQIQQEINAPKSRTNNFGHYNYRNAEDILKAAKPICAKYGCVLLLSDEVREIGSAYTYNTQQQDTKKGVTNASQFNGTRFYVESTATIINSTGEKISVKAYAREEVAKAGMDASQITGSASSYARKYALNGLFAIDDGIDADTTNNGQQPQHTNQQQPQQPVPQSQRTTGDYTTDDYLNIAMPQIEAATKKEDLIKIYNSFPTLQAVPAFKSAMTAKRKALGIKNTNE